MSVAFTREEDLESVAADLPDRPISAHRNLVTPEGLAAIEAELEAAREAYAAARAAGEEVKTDRTAMARATRDLRYWSARRANAELTEFDGGEVVRFGARVTFEREDGRAQTFHIVGEDEADPAAGKISYVSPLARALLGRAVGEVARTPGGEVEIVEIA
jgi:transcription elongation GreA/GreB family factor